MQACCMQSASYVGQHSVAHRLHAVGCSAGYMVGRIVKKQRFSRFNAKLVGNQAKDFWLWLYQPDIARGNDCIKQIGNTRLL